MTSSPADIYDRLWDSREYLRQYYSTPEVADDEIANIAFARKQFAKAGRAFPRAIEVGCGPTLHHAMLLAPYVGRLDLADYVPDNLAEVRKSLDEAPGAHDWSVYLKGMIAPGGASADELWALVKAHAGELRQMDIRQSQVGAYDLVASYYTAECVAETQAEWRQCLATLAGLVAPGGVLLLGVVRHCRAYNVCGQVFPATYVDEADFANVLPTLGFDADSLVIEVAPVAEWVDQGFDSICCVWATKKAV
jgi:hypothetical protein